MMDQQFEALVGERAFRLELNENYAKIDDHLYSYTFERVTGNTYSLLLDGRSSSIFIEVLSDQKLQVIVDGHSRTVHLKDENDLLLEELGIGDEVAAAEKDLRAPMPGVVLSVLVEPGQIVNPDDGLVVIEAMKMENELRAPAKAAVTTVHVAPGDTVEKDQLLLELDTSRGNS